jgi:hypothetical protein
MPIQRVDHDTPVSLKKIRYVPIKCRVLFQKTYCENFTESRACRCAGLAGRTHPELIGRRSLYSSQTKGQWPKMLHIGARVPEGCRASASCELANPDDPGLNLFTTARR